MTGPAETGEVLWIVRSTMREFDAMVHLKPRSPAMLAAVAVTPQDLHPKRTPVRGEPVMVATHTGMKKSSSAS